MPQLRIPKQYYDGLHAILKLSPASFDSFVGSLGAAGPTLDWSTLRAALAVKSPEISASGITAILEALVALYSVRASIGLNEEEFVDAVCEALEESGDFKEITADRAEDIRRRLANLLSLHDSFGIASKARYILHEYPNVFCSARIMTDARPVFGVDVTKRPSTAVVVHSLRIHYHGGGRMEEMYFALDSDDVKTLRELLERAEQKAESLTGLLQDAGVSCLETETK